MIRVSASISVQYDNPFSPFRGCEWEKGFEWVKACGFDAVEIILSDPSLLDFDRIRRKLDALELGVSTISTGQAMGMEGIAMTSPSALKRQAARERLFADIDFSAAFGKPNVTVGLIRGRGGEASPDIEEALLCRELSVAAEYAAKKGVVLNLEPINRYECKLVHSTAEGDAILEKIGRPENVGILYDTFHSNIEDPDMLAEIQTYAGSISHVHFADSNRSLPGEGHIDFPAVIRTLEQNGYNGYVSLEVLNRPDMEHIRDFAAAAMRGCFGQK